MFDVWTHIFFPLAMVCSAAAERGFLNENLLIIDLITIVVPY